MRYKDFDLQAAHLEAAKVSGNGNDVLCTVIIWPNNPKTGSSGSVRDRQTALGWTLLLL